MGLIDAGGSRVGELGDVDGVMSVELHGDVQTSHGDKLILPRLHVFTAGVQQQKSVQIVNGHGNDFTVVLKMVDDAIKPKEDTRSPFGVLYESAVCIRSGGARVRIFASTESYDLILKMQVALSCQVNVVTYC
jgi:hypothetical protein